MPPRLNSKQFQNNVIDFICERLGIHAYASLKNRITFHITRGSIVFQLWIRPTNAAVVYIPAEKKPYRRTRKYMGKKKKACQWTPTHWRIFEEVIEYDLELYLISRRDCFGELVKGIAE